MTKYFSISLLLYIAFSTVAQDRLTPYSSEANFYGRNDEYEVAPDGSLWTATATGNLYYSDSIDGLWHRGPFGSDDPFKFSGGNHFDRISFLSENVALISGYIRGESNRTNIVYRSVDHGKTWETLEFGKESWIDAFYTDGNGKVWMSGSSQLIYYSDDYGATWTSFDKVEQTGNLRFNTIHFSPDNSIGLFGSFWNVIYVTEDNCQTWKKLPTPLTQKKYERISTKSRPDIRKIRILGDQLVVNQQGHIYYSKLTSIDWIPLDDYTDFEVTKDEQLYAIRKDGTVDLLDAEMNIIWSSKAPLEYPSPKYLVTRNNQLYAFNNGAVQCISPQLNRSSRFWTNDEPIEAPYNKFMYKNELYGSKGNYILKLDVKKDAWFRLQSFDSYVGDFTVYDGSLILSQKKQYYTFDPVHKTMTPFELPTDLFLSDNRRIEGFTIEQGSSGCYHFSRDTVNYVRKGELFVRENPSMHYLTKMADEIPTPEITTLVQLINYSRDHTSPISEYNFTSADIQDFIEFIEKTRKKGIDKWAGIEPHGFRFPGDQIDFDFYIQAVQSIDTLSPEVIEDALLDIPMVQSTTSNWFKIYIELSDGTTIELAQRLYLPGYLNLPFFIDYEGISYNCTSVKLAEHINSLTKNEFIPERLQMKRFALFNIVNYLYKESLDRP